MHAIPSGSEASLLRSQRTMSSMRRAMCLRARSTAGTNTKYFVTLHERQFPIKQVLRLVTGLPPFGFTAQDAHRILSRLRFDIFEDQKTTTGPSVRSRVASGPLHVSAAGTGSEPGHEMLRLVVVFETDEDGWEAASCPTLPGRHSQGRTRNEALNNIREAIQTSVRQFRATWRACASTTSLRHPHPTCR